MNNLDIENIIIKMIFIYNALLSGWNVSMIDCNKFEFRRNIGKEDEIKMDTYLKKFIEYNMNIDNLNRVNK